MKLSDKDILKFMWKTKTIRIRTLCKRKKNDYMIVSDRRKDLTNRVMYHGILFTKVM